jgi:DICT domain-containing protein
MDFNPAFSVYETIEKQRPENIFLSRLNHMYHFSRVIEQDIIKEQLNQPIYVGMQTLHNLNPVLHRYQKIAAITDAYVFGLPDATIQAVSGLNFVLLTLDAKLANEWFLIVNHPRYAKILSAREIEPAAKVQQERTFEAILTTDKTIVEQVSGLLVEQLSAYKQVES